ncbi:MAG: DNA cytosine methyltransferase, partial [Kiritimatiellae bacterium]|nr:DNA cytosine methyltransferase [Kiritimatiellia bacterium]
MYTSEPPIRFIDLFCGIGGFRYAITSTAQKRDLPIQCVLSSDIDPHCQAAYKENFGE